MENKAELFSIANEVISENDKGHYTVPTHGLYPFQWNWDSCLTALGMSHTHEERAWTEFTTLFDHQWEDGMVPHIIFHEHDEGYFPGPEVWKTGRKVPTSGITQPAVAGFAIRRLYDRCKDKSLAEKKVRELLPKVAHWHEWFFNCRDPQGSGLVALIHPWESGRDNSIDWDEPFEHVPADGVEPFVRRDTTHANPEHRPTQYQYERYIWLLQHFRSLGWDNSQLHDASPFQVVDPGFNAILLRSCADLADLAEHLGETEIATANRAKAKRGLAALDSLWSDQHGQYLCYDRKQQRMVSSLSIGGILPVFADIGSERAEKIAMRINRLASRAKYIIPSHDPDSPEFDGDRYWRGPVWLIVNYMIADGLIAGRQQDTANTIISSSLDLIQHSSLAEYYDPHSGEGCGGSRFTWTAAMVIEFLAMTESANDNF